MSSSNKNINERESGEIKYSGAEILLNIESSFPGYNKHIVKLISEGLNYKKGKVLDFGAGSGTLAEIWQENFNVSPDCIEVDSSLVTLLKKKGLNVFITIKQLNQKYSYIYSSNVLEHIQDDVQAITLLKSVLKDDGLFAIYVPACPILFTELDEEVGHFRRYTKESLRTVLEKSGFCIITMDYCDFLGFFITLLLKYLRVDTTRVLKSDAVTWTYEKFILPFSTYLDRLGFRHVIGKNILVVAKKAQ